MRLKPGVRLHGIRPELVLAFVIAERIYAENGDVLEITSVIDGTHMRASIHYMGGAGDIGLPKSNSTMIANRIAVAVGEDFDVILEGDHIHIEWQPKSTY